MRPETGLYDRFYSPVPAVVHYTGSRRRRRFIFIYILIYTSVLYSGRRVTGTQNNMGTWILHEEKKQKNEDAEARGVRWKRFHELRSPLVRLRFFFFYLFFSFFSLLKVHFSLSGKKQRHAKFISQRTNDRNDRKPTGPHRRHLVVTPGMCRRWGKGGRGRSQEVRGRSFERFYKRALDLCLMMPSGPVGIFFFGNVDKTTLRNDSTVGSDEWTRHFIIFIYLSLLTTFTDFFGSFFPDFKTILFFFLLISL